MLKTIQKIKSPKTACILKIQSCVVKTIHDVMYEKGITCLMPVMISTITDPLCHDVIDADIDYYGQKLKLTKSMILHKQISLMSPDIKGIYIMSPNIRLETKTLEGSPRHLLEFTQLDIEFKDKTKKEFIEFMEDLIIKIITRVKTDCKEELKTLKRKLEIPKRPFKIHESKELKEQYGKDYEKILSKESKEPFWIFDLEREFYDREDKITSKYFHNYDLVWPEGFEEALSGGEREHEYEEIVRKMKEREMDLEAYSPFLELAKDGHLPKTVGGGLGIERAMRYLTGFHKISDVSLFPRTPGTTITL